MQITFWGVRGSIATSGPEMARFGGNTTCVEVRSGTERLILDAGTGVRALGDRMMKEAKLLGSAPKATFLFTHLHWDHIQGFPFFGPAFRPDATLSLYGPRDTSTGALRDEAIPPALPVEALQGIEAALARQMQPPHFPVSLTAMGARKEFHTVTSGDALEIGPFSVRIRALDHPQGSLGYRIEAGGRSICFATDTEHRGDRDVDEALLDLGRDVDLLIHDAQYTEAEYAGKEGPSRKGWGHSTYVAAAKIARACGARQLALFHHDPGHDDEVVASMERDARTLYLPTFAAREGLTVDL